MSLMHCANMPSVLLKPSVEFDESVGAVEGAVPEMIVEEFRDCNKESIVADVSVEDVIDAVVSVTGAAAICIVLSLSLRRRSKMPVPLR